METRCIKVLFFLQEEDLSWKTIGLLLRILEKLRITEANLYYSYKKHI